MTNSNPTPIVSINPATLAPVGEVQADTPDGVREKIKIARAAQPAWAALTFEARGKTILKARDWLLAHRDEVALTIVRDMGKDYVGAISAEILPTLDLFTHFAKKAEGYLYPRRLSIGLFGYMGRESYIHYLPVGVVAVISPWNFPFAIPADEVAMALMCGNSVILKPTSNTPLVGAKIGEMFAAAGLPPGVFQVVQGPGALGSMLVKGGVDKIAFTGGVSTGKRVMADASETLTPVVLELGGKGPMIICADANVEVASSAAVFGGFYNNGQVCASVERLYVHESIVDDFTKRVVAKVKQLKMGSGEELDVDLGSMANQAQLETVERMVNEARAQGAQILTGGKRPEGFKGYYYEPTVLAGMNHGFTMMHEEVFGPTLPIMPFKDEEEVIRLANDSRLALTASVWTKDLERGRRLAERVEAGTVIVNDVAYTHGIPATPWGGWKDSGMGRSHGDLGLMEFVHAHHIHTNKNGWLKDFWWFKNSADKRDVLYAMCDAQFGPTLGARLGGLWRAIRIFIKVGKKITI